MTPQSSRGARRHAAPRSLRARRTAVVVVTLAGTVLLPTGIAQAYWRSAGTGTGAATGGTVSALTAQTATATGTTLAPGGTGTLIVRVTNPNTVAVTVTGISANGSVTAAGGLGTCATYAVALQTPTAGLPATVPAGSTVSLMLINGVAMTSGENGCQGATFAVPVTVTGRTS